MSKYCLSYDAKNVEELGGSNTVKMRIVEILKQIHVVKFNTPAESTLLFYDDLDVVRVKKIDKILQDEFGGNLYYYLCYVTSYVTGGYAEIDRGNKALDETFQEQI